MNTEEMREVFKWSRIVLIVLAVFLGVQALEAFKNLRDVDPSYNSISVSGEGEVVSMPDVATFSFTVSADADTVSVAQTEVTRKMDAVLEALEGLGIEERDIKTTNYSIWPKYVYEPTVCSPNFCPPSRQTQDGYTVSHDVSVKVRNTEDAGEALALVGSLGATGLSGISFTVDEPEELLASARAEAIADAKAKAELLAEELGVKLVRVVSFYDNTDPGRPYYSEQALSVDAVRVGGSAAPTLPIGENKTSVTVTVIYEIR